MIAVALLVNMALSAQSTVTIDNVVYEYSGTTATVTGCEDTNVTVIKIPNEIIVSGTTYTVTGVQNGVLDACTKVSELNIQSNDWSWLDKIDITKMRYTLRIGLGGLWYYHKGGTWGKTGEYFSVGDNASAHQNVPTSQLNEYVQSEIKDIPVTKITGNININIKYLAIPASIEEISGTAFAENHLISISVDSSNPNFMSADGVLFDKNGETLLAYPAEKSITYTVPESVKSGTTVKTIGMCAFGKSTKLTAITLSSTITTIGQSAFDRLTNLSTFNTGNVTTIGKSAFANSGLTSITFDGALKTIGNQAFQYCKKLTSITIPTNVETIEAQAFYGCDELETVTFETPTKLTAILSNTFAKCPYLQAIRLPEGIVTIGSGAFNPSGLTEAYLPTSASNVHENAFEEDVIIHRTLALDFEGSDKWATYYSRENLTIPEGLKVYVVKGVNEANTALDTEEITFIPKDTPILIERPLGTETAPFYGSTPDVVPELPEGLFEQFKGSTTGINNMATLTGDKFILKGDQFIKTHTGSLPAFRCYLQLDNGTDYPSTYWITNEDKNTIILQEEGKRYQGTATATVTGPVDGKMTIIVSPADALYADAENITVRRSIVSDRARMPGINQDVIEITPVSKDDQGRWKTFTFPYTEGWNYEVTVNFQKRIDLLDAANKPKVNLTIPEGGYTYDGTAHEPVVASVTVGDPSTDVDPSYYDVSYKNNVYAGTATAEVKGKGHYKGAASTTFIIGRRNISNVTYTPATIEDQTYAHIALEPAITVTDVEVGGVPIIADDDYELEYDNNVDVGTAKIVIKAKETNYTGTKNVFFSIIPKELSDGVIQFIENKKYTGSAIEPTITVKDGDFTVTEDNYTVAYDHNIEVGTANVTVTFKKNYKGSAKATFQIVDDEITRTLNVDFEGTAQWATFYTNENLTIPEGLKAYVVTGLSESILTVAEVTFIPKDKAILLQRTGSQVAPFQGKTMPASTALPSEIKPDEALFKGAITDLNLADYDGNKFVLVNDQFVQTTAGTLAANRCYLNTGSTAIDGVISLVTGKSVNGIILQEEGEENPKAGTVTKSDPKDGKVTITVTPISVLYAEAENITVVRSASGNKAKAPSKAPAFDDSKVVVTAVNPMADPSGTTQYTFEYVEDYDYQVIVDFQKRKDFTKQSSHATIAIANAERVFKGSAWEPSSEEITVTWDDVVVDPRFYDISYKDNTNAGRGKVIITGKWYYMNTKEATFNIAQRSIKLATVQAIPNKTYTGTAIEPELNITDIVDGNNIITVDDYRLEYSNNLNVGTAKVAIIANNTNYNNIQDVFFDITAKNITETATIRPIDDQLYTGSPITPTITVMDGPNFVSPDYYDAVFTNNIESGKATVTVTFKGNYEGIVSTTFQIKDAVLTRTLNLNYEGTDKWATYYSAENLTIPEGLKAYVVTGISGSTLETSEITFIPKDVAILLERTGSQTAPFHGNTMPTSTTLEGVTPDDLLFMGTTDGMSGFGKLSGYKYVLVNDQFKLTAEGDLPPNRCALVSDAPISGTSSLAIGKGPDDIVLLEEGKTGTLGNAYTTGPRDGVKTITVYPADAICAMVDDITVVRSIKAGHAKAPSKAPGFDDGKVKVTPVNPLADPSGRTQYTFPYEEGYNYQVTVDFEKRIDLLNTSTYKPVITLEETNYAYDGTAHEPNVVSLVVTANGMTSEVDPSNYTVSYENNVNAGGEAKVVITGKRFLTGSASKKFNIAQRDINLINVKSIADQTYAGSPVTPALTMTDMVGGKNIITADDYTLEFFDNNKIGKAKVAIKANNTNYKNIKDVYFNIVPKKGDANGDGNVNITDAVCVVDYILGKNPEGLIQEAADINKDGTINITDAVGIVDIILGQ